MSKQTIVNADFYPWCMENVADNSVSAIITDPPYPQKYLPLWSQLGEVAAKKLKPSGLLIAYSGQYHLPKVMNMLGAHLNYYWIGCLQHKGTTGIVFPRKFIAGWKPILFYQKSPIKKLHKGTTDFFVSGGRDKVGHKWKQSESGVAKLVSYFTKEEDLVLEPFAGAGTTLVVCKQLNRSCIGIEIEKHYADLCAKNLGKDEQ